ncbi:MAG: S-layer homology domain-containing protein, partial [Pseudanabaena sp.]
PNATWDGIRQTWGFKDSDLISENALGAIFADAQLRDLSNIRRSFGFTTLLQPQKPVTRAEAAATLWYFGTEIDGISANKVIELDR